MYKTIVAAAIAFASVSAKFAPAEFIRSKFLAQENGAVTWKSCPSDGGFKTDFANTKSNPLIPVKGSNVDLLLQGIWTDDADLEAIKVFCKWNGTALYQQEFARNAHYKEGDVLKDKITWLIPSFAPSGHYTVTLTLHDKGNENVFGCIQADFDL